MKVAGVNIIADEININSGTLTPQQRQGASANQNQMGGRRKSFAQRSQEVENLVVIASCGWDLPAATIRFAGLPSWGAYQKTGRS